MTPPAAGADFRAALAASCFRGAFPPAAGKGTGSVPGSGRSRDGSSIQLTRLSGGLLGWETARTATDEVNMVLCMLMMCFASHSLRAIVYLLCVCLCVVCVGLSIYDLYIDFYRVEAESRGGGGIPARLWLACFAAPAFSSKGWQVQDWTGTPPAGRGVRRPCARGSSAVRRLSRGAADLLDFRRWPDGGPSKGMI